MLLSVSFPRDSGDAMNRWISHHFSRKSRAKCLILIGPTGTGKITSNEQLKVLFEHVYNANFLFLFNNILHTGKTSFALSLPGVVNYFKGRWHLDNWNPQAKYCVFDDIGWDNFEKLNYPSKKDLLTQNGLTGVRFRAIDFDEQCADLDSAYDICFYSRLRINIVKAR